MDPESGSGGAIGRKRQNLSGLDSAGSTDVRSHLAQLVWSRNHHGGARTANTWTRPAVWQPA